MLSFILSHFYLISLPIMIISIKQETLSVAVALEEDDFEKSVHVRSFSSLLKM